jgi:hypothetical protein
MIKIKIRIVVIDSNFDFDPKKSVSSIRDLRRTPIPDYDSDSVGVGVGVKTITTSDKFLLFHKLTSLFSHQQTKKAVSAIPVGLKCETG